MTNYISTKETQEKLLKALELKEHDKVEVYFSKSNIKKYEIVYTEAAKEYTLSNSGAIYGIIMLIAYPWRKIIEYHNKVLEELFSIEDRNEKMRG